MCYTCAVFHTHTYSMYTVYIPYVYTRHIYTTRFLITYILYILCIPTGFPPSVVMIGVIFESLAK